MIPFVGSAFSRSSFGFMQSGSNVDVPISRFAEGFMRLLLLITVLVGGYLFFEPMLRRQAVKIEDEQIATSFGWEEEKFTEFLRDCDRQQLITVMQEWIVDPNLPYESRRLVIKNQIKAANKIARSRMNQQRSYGVSKELQLRSELAMMDLKQGIFNSEQNEELVNLATLYKAIQFELSDAGAVVNEKAKLGEIIGEMIDLVESADLEADVGLIDDLLEKVSQLSDHFLSSSETGQTLSRLADLAGSRLEQLDKPTDLANRLKQLLNNIHTENKSLRIKELAEIDGLNASATKLIYLPSDKPEFKDRFLVDFRNKLEQVFEVDDVNEADYSMVLTKLNELSESGWSKAAIEMLAKVKESFRESGNYPKLQEQARKLESRLNWVGQKFSFDAMKTLENHRPAFRDSNALATIVIYISMNTQRESDIRFKQLGRVYNSVFRNAKIDFLVVFMHEDDARDGLQAMRVLADRMKLVDFVQLNVNTAEGKQFSRNLSINETPYVQILDRSRRVASLNPRAKIVVEILNRLNIQDETDGK